MAALRGDVPISVCRVVPEIGRRVSESIPAALLSVEQEIRYERRDLDERRATSVPSND